MKDVSLQMVDYINLFLSEENQLSLTYENSICRNWGSIDGLTKLSIDTKHEYRLIHKKRMVSFTEELITDFEPMLLQLAIKSILDDVGIDVSKYIGVWLHNLNGEFIYARHRQSYGGVIALDYVSKRHVGDSDERYLSGLTYLHNVGNVCVKAIAV